MKVLGENQPYSPQGRTGRGGYYQMSLKSGLVTGVASGDTIFSLRFVSAPKDGTPLRMQLKYFKVMALIQTAFATPQLCDFYAYAANNFTASDTGGTQVLPAAGEQKRNTNAQDSQFVAGGDIRIATTGALGVGTRTLEAQPYDSVQFMSAAGGLAVPLALELNEHHVPLVFEHNQGIVFKVGTAFGATGVMQFWFDFSWMEEGTQSPAWF